MLHKEVCDLLCIAKMYSTAYRPQANDTGEWCNCTLLTLLRVVVSEQQDDWDDQLPALLSAYRSTPHSSMGVSLCHMVYGVEMTMPLDLVIGNVGREWPNVYSPTEYVEWLRGSIRDAHAMARTNLKEAAKCLKRGYGETSQTATFQQGDWVRRVYPLAVVVNCSTEIEGHGLCWLKQVL